MKNPLNLFRGLVHRRFWAMANKDPKRAVIELFAIVLAGMLLIATLFFGSALLLCIYGHGEYALIHVIAFILWFGHGIDQMYPNGIFMICRVPSRLDEMFEENSAAE